MVAKEKKCEKLSKWTKIVYETYRWIYFGQMKELPQPKMGYQQLVALKTLYQMIIK